jgi:hypothetical protein
MALDRALLSFRSLFLPFQGSSLLVHLQKSRVFALAFAALYRPPRRLDPQLRSRFRRLESDTGTGGLLAAAITLSLAAGDSTAELTQAQADRSDHLRWGRRSLFARTKDRAFPGLRIDTWGTRQARQIPYSVRQPLHQHSAALGLRAEGIEVSPFTFCVVTLT